MGEKAQEIPQSTPRWRSPPPLNPSIGRSFGAIGGLMSPVRLPVPEQAVMSQSQQPLTASRLAAVQPKEQKQMLGEYLHPLIRKMYPVLAGKITGMFLEMDNAELLHLLENNESLKSKVEEAVEVLKVHKRIENEERSTRMSETGRACSRARPWRRHAPSESAFLRPPRTFGNCCRVEDHGEAASPVTLPAELVPEPTVPVPCQTPLTASELAAVQPQERKQMLGERLYPLIKEMYPELAGKITGMLLEIDNAELLHLLENDDSLRSKVEEAVAALKASPRKDVTT